MNLKKLQKLLNAINTYYGSAVLLYTAVLYFTAHSHLFRWIFMLSTPILTAWSGYLLKGYLDSRNLRYAFRKLSDVMTYEIVDNHKYILRFTTTLKAGANHLLVYPIAYQWTGRGEESVPTITNPGQQLLAHVKRRTNKDNTVEVAPTNVTTETNGDWHYWFIGLNPPVHKDEIVEIKYSQEFYDTKASAKPYLYYFVKTKMKRLELNVKFPAGALPQKVTGYYIKPSDPGRPYTSKDVDYDSDKQWATWTINHPKKGYCYRIEWQ
jgi:hypothetical protein